jgi:nucleoid-associated protein YejK
MRNLTAAICLTIAVLFTTKQVFAQEVTFICETRYFSINPNSEILKKLEGQNFRLYVSDKSLRYETFLKGQKRAVKHQYTITDTSKGFWIGLGGLLHSPMDHAKMATLRKISDEEYQFTVSLHYRNPFIKQQEIKGEVAIQIGNCKPE